MEARIGELEELINDRSSGVDSYNRRIEDLKASIEAHDNEPVTLKVDTREGEMKLTGIYVGDGLVAVGKRGIILLSDDSGESWRQGAGPTRANLRNLFSRRPNPLCRHPRPQKPQRSQMANYDWPRRSEGW